MYSHVPMCARVAGQVGDYFDSKVGVKQGDPLSPLLFGLFLDGVEQHIRSVVPGAGVRIGGGRCPLLFYADDIVLLATTSQQLQAQLVALHQFCDVQGMQVNVPKTKLLVTGEKRPYRDVYSYAGEPLEQVAMFKYLGVEVHAIGGMKGSHDAIATAATKAL